MNSSKAFRKSTRRPANRTVTALALLIGVVGSGFAGVQTSAAAPVSLSINRGDQQAVANAYKQVFKAAKAVPVGWTGDASSCVPGNISTKAKDATFTAINYFRAMAGVKPVPENAAASQRAQAVATVMAANRGLTHNPGDVWGAGFACAGIYPERQADEGEILRQGITGAKAVESFIDGSADADASVGHRMLLLGTDVVSIGIGATSDYAAGRIQLSASGAAQDVAWPGTGYFPAELLPQSNRWSYQSATADMGQASVTVTGPTGEMEPPVVYSAGKLVVWQMPELPEASEAADTYHVQIVTASSIIEYDVYVFSAVPKTSEAVAEVVVSDEESAQSTTVDDETVAAEPMPTVTVTVTASADETELVTPIPTATVTEVVLPEPTVTITELVKPQPTVTVTVTANPKSAPVASKLVPPKPVPAPVQISLKVTGLNRRGSLETQLGKEAQNLAAVASGHGRNHRVSYSISGQPKGVTINQSTGVISGIPQRSGTYHVTVTAKVNGAVKSEQFTWLVTSPRLLTPEPTTPNPTAPSTLGPNQTGDTKPGPNQAPVTSDRQREQRSTDSAPAPTENRQREQRPAESAPAPTQTQARNRNR